MRASLKFDLENPKQKEQYDAYFKSEKMRLALKDAISEITFLKNNIKNGYGLLEEEKRKMLFWIDQVEVMLERGLE